MNELDGIEHEFDTAELERRRVELRKTATAFAEAEALNGFPTTRGDDRRNTGSPSGELDTDPEAYATASLRSRTIRETAQAFATAHDDLLRDAKRAGYDLGAITSPAPRPPWETDPMLRAAKMQRDWEAGETGGSGA